MSHLKFVNIDRDYQPQIEAKKKTLCSLFQQARMRAKT